jgi:ribosomal protein L11 methyltransferase
VIRLALRVRREQAELALAELLELAPAGVEELDLGAAGIEYAVYGTPGELPSLPDLRVAAGAALVDVSTSEIDDDWTERWRQFHRPVLISPANDAPPGLPALHIRPSWEAPSSPTATPRRVREIVIEPGQAFGTGSHASTRLCLELLLELAASGYAGGRLIDVGCGSGVLSIAAACLGWQPVLGLDHEPESVTATLANAELNGVEVIARLFDLREQPLPAGHEPPVIAANLLRPMLLRLAFTMTVRPCHLVASGLLADEIDEVADAFARSCQLAVRARRSTDGWAALWLSSKD